MTTTPVTPAQQIRSSVVDIEIVGTLTPTELVRSLMVKPHAAKHVYALLGAVLTNGGHIQPRDDSTRPGKYVSPAERDEAMRARMLDTNARQTYLMGMTVRLERLRLHMTRAALAEKAGVSYSFLAGIESGQKGMSWDVLDRLADALNTTSTALMAEADGLGMPA